MHRDDLPFQRIKPQTKNYRRAADRDIAIPQHDMHAAEGVFPVVRGQRIMYDDVVEPRAPLGEVLASLLH